ncbi:MAG: polymerase IV protein, partial [Candidatus Curtissbacteria bacterium GW2011_GWA1_40_9]
VSIGISYNRLLAKLASEQIKPDGLFWITEDNIYKVLDKSNLMDVCGIGWGLYHHLAQLGIYDFPKLRFVSREFLHDNFGPFWGPYLWDICRGIDRTPVNSFKLIPEQKSVGRTYTAHRLLTKRHEIFKVARNLCEEATFKARRMGLAGRYVAFSLREGRGGKIFWGHKTLKTYIDDGKKLFDVCRLISGDWDIKEAIFCGVTLGMLSKAGWQPIPIFRKDRKYARLVSSVDTVNKRFGHYTIFPGQLLGMPIVMPEVTGYFGDKKFRLNFLRKSQDF